MRRSVLDLFLQRKTGQHPEALFLERVRVYLPFGFCIQMKFISLGGSEGTVDAA